MKRQQRRPPAQNVRMKGMEYYNRPTNNSNTSSTHIPCSSIDRIMIIPDFVSLHVRNNNVKDSVY